MAGPQGYRDIPEEDRKKAKVFFDRAASVAASGQFDFAIVMYLEGLGFDPESIEAHQALRDISLKRKAMGGKKLGMMDLMKMKTSRDDKAKMTNAERAMSHDPGNTDHMLTLMEAAAKLAYYDTVMWIGPITLRANLDGKKDLGTFQKLKENYIRLHVWDRATEAAQYALQQKPDDMDLQREVKDLGAKQTMKEGNYEGGGNFRDSIRDREGQEKLQRQDSDIRTEDQMSGLIRDAEAEWKANPVEPGKLMKFANLLAKTENLGQENRAIDLLENAFKETKQYGFRQRADEIRIRQMGRTLRSLLAKAQSNPKDETAVREYREFKKEMAQEELRVHTASAENYPTQLEFQFNMAKKMFELQMFGEAIPVFQKARQDPKYRVDSSVMLGRAFLEAGFFDEAVDTLKDVINDYQLKGDEKSIDMTYWYGRSLEEKGDKQAAAKAFSQVAQWNFNFRDVQKRIKALRSQPTPQ